MRPAALSPAAQIFVCVNVRRPDDPLASGCGVHGPGVYTALKREIGARGRVRDVWITRAACLGQCPRTGCSVAVYPSGAQLVDVTETDAPALASAVLAPTTAAMPTTPRKP